MSPTVLCVGANYDSIHDVPSPIGSNSDCLGTPTLLGPASRTCSSFISTALHICYTFSRLALIWGGVRRYDPTCGKCHKTRIWSG